MDNPITDPVQASPAWLTMVLEESGCLNRGRVIEVHKSSRSTITSTISRLERSKFTVSEEACGEIFSTTGFCADRPPRNIGSITQDVGPYLSSNRLHFAASSHPVCVLLSHG